MDPHQKYHWCIHIVLRKMFKIMFQNIFAEKPKLSAGNLFIIGLFVSGLLACCYTICTYDQRTAFLCSIMCGCFVQAFSKYIFVDDIKSLVEIAEFIEDIYKKNTEPNTRLYYSVLCQLYAKRTEIIVKAVLIGYTTMYFGFVLLLLLDNLYMGEMVPIFRIYLPDCHSLGGAILLNVFNYVVVLAVYWSVGSFDALIYVIFANIPIASSIIIGHLDELREALLDANFELCEIRNRLIQIILMHNKYNENVRKLDKGFFKNCIFQIVTASTFTVSGIFISLWDHSLPAYLVIACGLIQIITYCMLGTIIQISSHRFYEAINSFDWYLLPPNQLKIYQMLLHHSQQPTNISIAGVLDLNMETCVSLTKANYSYAMVLYSTV